MRAFCYFVYSYTRTIHDEQLQLALAISASLTPDHELPTEIGLSRKSRKRRKVEQEVPPLLTTSPSEARTLTVKRAMEILKVARDEEEEEDIPCTPVFGPSALAGGGVQPVSGDPARPVIGEPTPEPTGSECDDDDRDRDDSVHDSVKDVVHVCSDRDGDVIEKNLDVLASHDGDCGVSDDIVEQSDYDVIETAAKDDTPGGEYDTATVSTDEARHSGAQEDSAITDGTESLGDTGTADEDPIGGETRTEVFAEYKTMWQLSSYREGEGVDTFYAPALLDHIQPVRTL